MPALAALDGWLGSWTGIGAVAVGMHRQGYDFQLTQYADQGWRANFCTTVIGHAKFPTRGHRKFPTPAAEE